MSEQMRVLQAIRLKGRPVEPEIATATGVHDRALRQILCALVDAGVCVDGRGRYQLTPAGRDAVANWIAEERDRVDQTALAVFYDRFLARNTAVKQVITDWQLIDGSTANDHGDPGYDARVIGRLANVHDAFRADLAGIVDLAPRLAPYPRRLAGALAKIRAGEHGWLAGPLVDSYHTIWFELHEDLLGLTGLARADEAAAGRAE